MAIKYVKPGPWGPGTGVRNSALDVDNNFFDHNGRIEELEDNASTARSIDYTTASGSDLIIHYTDHTFDDVAITLPRWKPRGQWQPVISYAVDDQFYWDGAAYIVEVAHLSGSSFDPHATDGMGHDLYAEIFVSPSDVLPTGGATGAVLAKHSGSDFDVVWEIIGTLPLHGGAGQVLAKHSGSDFDVMWEDAPSGLPAGGTTGEVLTKHSGADGDVVWAAAGGSDTDEPIGYVALSASTGNVFIDTTLGNVFALTPTGDCTMQVGDAATPPAGRRLTLLVKTSGTTAHNVAMAAVNGYIAQGGLDTGTVSGKRFTVSFIVDNGGNLVETGRTVAM